MTKVEIDFKEQAKGYVAEVKIEVSEGVTDELLEDLTNKAYNTALSAFERATSYTAIKSIDKK